MTKDPTKRQHFVPRVYLRRFVPEDSKQLHAYDLRDERHFTSSPEGVAAEHWFYESDSTDLNEIENLLANWDDLIRPVLGRIDECCEQEMRRLLVGPGTEVIEPFLRPWLSWLVLIQLFPTRGSTFPGPRDGNRCPAPARPGA